MLLSTPKAAEGEGVMWQWLGVLQWPFLVAIMVGVCEQLMTVVGSGGCRVVTVMWWWECLCLYLVTSLFGYEFR